MSTDEKKTNILFIFTDDHAAHAISAYGSKINKTPNLDRIAKEGVVFDNCFCGNSICSPSRATVMTGKHSHKNGVMCWEEFDGSQYTFPKQMQNNGYATAIFGKWHLTSAPTGFDEWMLYPGQGSYYNPDYRTPDGIKRINGYAPEITTDMSLDFIKRNKEKPFLMMCHFKAPHRTWMPGPEYMDMYEDQDIPEPDNLFDDYSNRSELLKENKMSIKDHILMHYDLKLPKGYDPEEFDMDPERFTRMTKEQLDAWNKSYDAKNAEFLSNPPKGDDLIRWKYQRYIKEYLRVIASVDDNVGRILDYLDESGLAENTLVVYSSDQGFFLGDHGWFDKRWMLEESLRMPLLMRWPNKIKTGTRIEELAHNIDFAPTFLDACGLDIPDEIQGESLLPLFAGTTSEWRDAVYYHYYDGPGEHGVAKHYGIRTLTHKLIYYYEHDDWDMFDLTKDQREMRSIYHDPEYTEVREELKTKLKELRRKYDDNTGLPISG